MMLHDLTILDLTAQIAAIPLRRQHTVLALRGPEEFITFHYSGVAYKDRSHAAELRHILDEASYQVNHNYGTAAEPAYPDGYLYDFAVLSDGTKVRTRKDRRQLWQAGNAIANKKSWSVHVLLGPGQDMTAAQRASLFDLFDALRAESHIPRQNVIAHCEWPRKDGLPSRSDHYRLLYRQSACPGSTLFPHVVAYRALPDGDQITPAPVGLRRFKLTCAGNANVRQGPGTNFPIAGTLRSGSIVFVDVVKTDGRPVSGNPNWLHMAHVGQQVDLGFISETLGVWL